MTTRLAFQRGVAALMAVLFLLFMLGVVLVIAHQMAATDVHDSGAHNLSVEALFLAESGIERASRRYRDNGALCAANGLAEVPMSIAGGTRRFSIISSAGNATTCTVNARGEIDNIRRQIQVVLQRTAGGGVIVDPTFDNPTIWDGDNNVVGGGVATFINPAGPGPTRNNLEARRPNAIDTSAFTPNVNVAMAVSFDYAVVGSVFIRVRVAMPGTDPTLFFTLSGSGTISLAALGTFDPTDITRIEIDVLNPFFNRFSDGESLVMDNLYVGPATGGGGAAAVAVTSWTEIVP